MKIKFVFYKEETEATQLDKYMQRESELLEVITKF